MKLNFVKKTISTLSSQNTLKISKAIVRETPEILSATDILLASIVKRLVVDQGSYLKRE